jgi:putative ABC transport system permease protein
MIRIALRMLMGDTAKYVGIIIGLTFASLLITQQAAIFVGLMTRTYSFISDTSLPDLWVMDQEVEQHADNKTLQETALQRVRGVEGVAWAMPMIKQWTPIRLPSGQLKLCILIGVDDATLIGGPPNLSEDSVEALRKIDGVLVDEVDLASKFAMKNPDTGREDRSLQVGDVLELNDHRASVVGTYRASPSFFWDPVVYTTYSRATKYLPAFRRVMNYVMVKAKDGENTASLAAKIHAATGLKALTPSQFKWATARFIIDKTGIAVNFGLAVLLGFIVGTVITGQTFYNFTTDNLRYFGALKAMGAGSGMLIRMVISQALFVGAIGYGLGVGGASIFGRLINGSNLAFEMPWPLLLISAVAVGFVCIIAALLSIVKVLRLEPAAVFK